VILRALGLYPGERYCPADLQAAEKNLIKLDYFQVNPKTGVRPTVKVIDPDSDKKFKDILVTVEEKPSTASVRPMFAISPRVGAGIALVWQERNFDSTRWPTSFDELRSGRAFRGGGQCFSAGLVWSIGPPRLFISLSD
ncbi:MAG TPA: hypothetical protein VGP68_23255, partial [Gemmataceae bacterium]|nr:hypothetical protein [Gemmataceae bacterium]